MLSLEDVLADRLRRFIYWEDSVSADQALALLVVPELDHVRLAAIAAGERFLAAGLAALSNWAGNEVAGASMDSPAVHELASQIKTEGG